MLRSITTGRERGEKERGRERDREREREDEKGDEIDANGQQMIAKGEDVRIVNHLSRNEKNGEFLSWFG